MKNWRVDGLLIRIRFKGIIKNLFASRLYILEDFFRPCNGPLADRDDYFAQFPSPTRQAIPFQGPFDDIGILEFLEATVKDG